MTTTGFFFLAFIIALYNSWLAATVPPGLLILITIPLMFGSFVAFTIKSSTELLEVKSLKIEFPTESLITPSSLITAILSPLKGLWTERVYLETCDSFVSFSLVLDLSFGEKIPIPTDMRHIIIIRADTFLLYEFIVSLSFMVPYTNNSILFLILELM